MNQKYMLPLAVVFLLFLLAYAGVEGAGLQWFFGIVMPYAALIVFLAGICLPGNGLGIIRRTIQDSHNLRTAEITSLVQTEPYRQPGHRGRRVHPDAA